MRFLKALWIAIFVFCALVFFIQNSTALITPLELQIDTYMGHVWTATAVPFYLVVLLGFLAGALVMLGYLLMDRLRLGRALRRARKQCRVLEKEVKNLREIPLPSQGLLEASPLEKTDASAQPTENK